MSAPVFSCWRIIGSNDMLNTMLLPVTIASSCRERRR